MSNLAIAHARRSAKGMNRTRTILALSAFLLSMCWSIGSIHGIVIVFLIRPLVLGATFATFWKAKKRMKRITFSLVGVVLCVLLSSMVYGLQTEWWYVLEDPETQGAIMLIAIWTALLTVITMELALLIKQKADPGASGQCR